VLTIVPLVESKEKIFPLLLSATMLAFVAKGLKYTMFGVASEVEKHGVRRNDTLKQQTAGDRPPGCLSAVSLPFLS
jgi:hypothetical protein